MTNTQYSIRQLLCSAIFFMALLPLSIGQVAYDLDENEKLGSLNSTDKEVVLRSVTEDIYYMASEVDQLPSIGKTCEYVSDPNACTAQLLNQYITEHLEVPQRNVTKGTYVKEVEFVVSENGKVEDTVIISSKGDAFCKPCNTSIINVLAEMTDWIPGIKDGEIVATKMTFPIVFNIR